MSLADYIEEYIKMLLSLSPRQWIDIQRSELAGKFNCVPSQINYVLATRFTPERGYLVESRRGGNGYIRILRVKPLSKKTWKDLFNEDKLDAHKARDFLQRLYEEKLISRREAFIIETTLHEDIYKKLPLNEEQKSLIMKRLFYNMITAILKES